MPKKKLPTMKDAYEACPKDSKILIGDWYCAPVYWISPTTGLKTGPFFVTRLSSRVYAELSLSGRLLETIPGSTDGYVPGWKDTGDERLKWIRQMVFRLRREIAFMSDK